MGIGSSSGRQRRCLPPEAVRGKRLLIDGYNVLTTVEAASAVASCFWPVMARFATWPACTATIEKVAETLPALELIGKTLVSLEVAEAVWLLDRPVSNSGRLQQLILTTAENHGWN